MSIRGILAALPYAIKKDVEEEAYSLYITTCIRLLTENTAKSVQGEATYITADYESIVRPKAEKIQKEGEAKKSICGKLSS
jgi:hypothetical protein